MTLKIVWKSKEIYNYELNVPVTPTKYEVSKQPHVTKIIFDSKACESLKHDELIYRHDDKLMSITLSQLTSTLRTIIMK